MTRQLVLHIRYLCISTVAALLVTSGSPEVLAVTGGVTCNEIAGTACQGPGGGSCTSKNGAKCTTFCYCEEDLGPCDEGTWGVLKVTCPKSTPSGTRHQGTGTGLEFSF